MAGDRARARTDPDALVVTKQQPTLSIYTSSPQHRRSGEDVAQYRVTTHYTGVGGGGGGGGGGGVGGGPGVRGGAATS